MEEAGPGPSSPTCGPNRVSDTPKHCIRLTREQYTTLTELKEDPLFRRAMAKAVFPPWEELMTGETEHKSFTWVVYYLWLGSLKFALLSRCVGSATELYEKIVTIFESLLSEFSIPYKENFSPPQKMRLIFDHLGDGMFQVRLTSYEKGVPPHSLGSSLSAKESRRTIRALSAKALHVTRTSNWPTKAVRLQYTLKKKFISFLDKEGTEVDEEKLVKVSEGRASMPFRHELRCTVSYIAEQLEKRGEVVDWESLHMKAMSVEDCRLPSFLSRISDDMEEFIQQRGMELLQGSCSHD